MTFLSKQEADKVANDVIAEIGDEWKNTNFYVEHQYGDYKDGIFREQGWHVRLENNKRYTVLTLKNKFWTLIRLHDGPIGSGSTPQAAFAAAVKLYNTRLGSMLNGVEAMKDEIEYMLDQSQS